MREKFIEELNKLNNELITMGSMCEDAINSAIMIIKEDEFSKELYDKVDALEDATDKKEKEIESLCLKLIFSQQPVASDLRFISAILKMISDLERIADQALDIADLSKEIDDFKLLRNTAIFEMAKLVTSMVKNSVDSFVRKDTQMAAEVSKMDNEVDKMFLKVKKETISMISDEDKEGEVIVDVLMMAKYLERIADHSTNIAEWVEFAIRG